MINLGNRIRELRKKNGITQEQLASALNMSPQAVSKWEMGAGYPDVATIPVIAGYFRISLDSLFDYDPEKTEEKIQEIYMSAQGVPFEIAEQRLLDGIAAYPGADMLKRDLLERYAGQIREYGRIEFKDKALAIGEKLIAESSDSFLVCGAKGDLADIHIATGNYEEGRKIIQSMPYLYHLNIHDRMRCSAMLLKEEDSLNAFREWKQWSHQDLFLVCLGEGMAFFEMCDYENALLSFEEHNNVIEMFLHREVPAEYRLLGNTAGQGMTMLRIAACLYKLGRLEECDSALDRARRLVQDSFNDEDWEKHGQALKKQYRDIYNYMGLDEYKPCII